jgi:hypothetical protein
VRSVQTFLKKNHSTKKNLRNYYSVQGKTRSPIRLFERIAGYVFSGRY